MSRKAAQTKPVDNDAKLDEATKERRQVLANMEKMSPDELFQIAVRAGIYTKDGKVEAPYREDAAPSVYQPKE